MGGQEGGQEGGQAAARGRPARDGDGIVATVFGSPDFHAAVPAFLAEERVTWQGR
ncbi:hypothetical protein [Nonomuraea jabiensis]|uniref:hypothetical protein n=1 Tax=Nonomuraea jabiensis TaxID=882448 RepID=UPI003D731C53